MRIKDVPFSVVGVLETKGQTTWGQDQDDVVLMPFSTAERRVLGSQFLGSVDMIFVSAVSQPDIEEASQQITAVLHEHPANEGRELGVNGLWLWGAGELPAALRAPWRSIASDDPLARGIARAAGIEPLALPRGAPAWLAALPGEGRHLALPGALDAAMDEAWFAPLLAALRSGRLGMLSLHAPEAGLAVEAVRLDLRRFWRRARPLESHAHR